MRLEEGEGDHAWGDVVLRAFEKEGRAVAGRAVIHMKMKLDVESVENNSNNKRKEPEGRFHVLLMCC